MKNVRYPLFLKWVELNKKANNNLFKVVQIEEKVLSEGIFFNLFLSPDKQKNS